ncbi:MAG: HU family DNA-binding protein, partial [Acidimicrobiales bacterium]
MLGRPGIRAARGPFWQTSGPGTLEYRSQTVNRRELVQATAAHGDLDPKMVDRAIKALTEVATPVTAKGGPVAISGFAKFAPVDLG